MERYTIQTLPVLVFVVVELDVVSRQRQPSFFNVLSASCCPCHLFNPTSDDL